MQAHISAQKKRSLSSSIPLMGNGSDNKRLHACTHRVQLVKKYAALLLIYE